MSFEGVAETRRLLGLQYLRAVAALAVLLVHALRADNSPWGSLGIGVDIFFVLSGFLMIAITDANTRPWPFIRARIARIGPLYWTLTLGVFALLCSGLFTHSLIPFQKILDYYQDIPWMRLLLSTAFVPVRTEYGIFPIVPAGWTLNLEMFFYLTFAVVLAVPRRMQLPLLSALFLGLVAIGHVWPSRHAWAIVWTSPMLLEFLAGAWMGWAWQRGASLLSAAGLILLAWMPCALLLANDPPIAPLAPERIVTIPPIVVLLAGVLALERRPGGIRDWAPARVLGDASYSIYLWQFIPIFFLGHLERPLGLASWQYAIGVFALGVGGGLALHYLLERPLLAFTRGWRSRDRGLPPTPG